MDAQSRAEQRLAALSQARKAAESSISLEVTILGDGRGTEGFTKRLQLRNRLQDHRFVGAVTIPELLHKALPDATPHEVEMSAIGEADVVLCLESPDRPPLGLYTELWSYFDDSTIDKWYLLRPADREQQPEDRALITGLARPMLDVIDSQDYDPAEWVDCQRITAAFEARIELIGRRRLRRKSFGLTPTS